MSLELYSTLNGNYVGIEIFTDLTKLQIHMAQEAKKEEANKWEITPKGKSFHYECFLQKDGSIESRRVPPLK